MTPLRFNVNPLQRFFLFLCASALCLIIGSIVVGFLLYGEPTTPRVRIAMVMQDLIMFILPALVTAMIITRQPAQFLGVDEKLKAGVTFYTIVCLLVSTIAMDLVISWNQSLTLPESLSGLEQWMRESEENAQSTIALLMGNRSVGSLIVVLMITGVLAGFSEEMFFRGTLQRLIITSGVNGHVAVWVTAFIFSAIHMQFFGFVPRLLLGAFFGYLFWWTRCLWLPIIAHVLNNCVAIALMWDSGNMEGEPLLAHPSGWLIASSVIFTILALMRIYDLSHTKKGGCAK